MTSRWVSQQDLKRLPWRRWRNNGGCWIYADEVPELAEKIKGNHGSILIGDYLYKLRRDGKFIVRIRFKKEV